MFVKKKDGETTSSLLYRFTKKVQHSGILRESKKRRFHSRNVNRNKRRVAAIYRTGKSKEHEAARKSGLY